MTCRPRARSEAVSGTTLRALEAGDREDELADWLDEHGIEDALDLASTLVSAGLDADWLSRLTGRRYRLPTAASG